MQIELKFTAVSQREAQKLAELFGIIVAGGILADKDGDTIDVPAKKLKSPKAIALPEEDDDEPAVRPSKSKGKKAPVEDDDDEDYEPKAKKDPKSKAEEPEDDEDHDEDDEAPTVKRGRGRPPKAKARVEDDDEAEDDDEEDEKPSKSKPTTVSKIAIEDVQSAVKVKAKKDRDFVLRLFKEFNAKNARDLDPKDYAAFMKKLA